jgi:RNA polymerase sigma-70 factor, ECF subfamily
MKGAFTGDDGSCCGVEPVRAMTGESVMSPGSPRLQEFLRAFEEHFAFVRRTLRRQGVPAADVDDLTQEVFIVMWRRWSEFDQSRALRPWLAAIAFNVVGSHHLRRPRREVPIEDFDATDEAPAGEEGLAASRARRFLLEVLERLPDTYRTILILRDLDGVPMRQIAAQQGVPLFTAYTRLRKARKDLAAAVRRHPEAPLRRPALVALSALCRSWRALLPAAAAGLLGLVLADQAVHGEDEGPALASPAAARPASGGSLLAYWRLDEGAGGTVQDRSGRGAHCLVRGNGAGPVWSTGRLGGALMLAGQGWLECPRPAPAEADPGELTVSAWVQARALPARGNRAVVSRPMGDETLDHFFLGFVNGHLTFNSNAWGIAIVHRVPLDQGWHHLAFTRSTGAVTLYLDGRPVGHTRLRQMHRAPVRAPLLVGGGSNGPGVIYELFDGAIDEIAIFGRALEAAEIAALAGGAQPVAGQIF